jgi:hypothetical protein
MFFEISGSHGGEYEVLEYCGISVNFNLTTRRYIPEDYKLQVNVLIKSG